MNARLRPTIELSAFYLVTQVAMTTALFTNSLLVMGIHDARAEQCSWMSAFVLGVMLAVATYQVGRGGEARWYPRSCVIVAAVALAMLLKGVLLRPVPTPQLMLDGWVVLLIIAALNGVLALIRYLVKRWP